LYAADYTGKNDPFPSACANQQRHPIYRHAVCRHVASPKRIMNEPAISMYTLRSQYEAPQYNPTLHKAYIELGSSSFFCQKKLKTGGAQRAKRQFAVTTKICKVAADFRGQLVWNLLLVTHISKR
jgi:hypothetical protein